MIAIKKSPVIAATSQKDIQAKIHFKKILSVITTCKTFEHITTSLQMIDHFGERFGKKSFGVTYLKCEAERKMQSIIELQKTDK